MKPGLARSSVHRWVLCVALKVSRSCLSPLRFVALVADVALVAFVAFVTGLITIRRGDLHGRPWMGWGVLSVNLAHIVEQGQAPNRRVTFKVTPTDGEVST